MLLRHEDSAVRELEKCHDGAGSVICRELLAEYKRPGPGFRFIHDNVIAPGSGVGVHRHEGDEEVYFVISGHGTMHFDGREEPIGPGDCCLTRDGHTHGILNTGDEPMRFLVFGVGT